MLSRLNANRSGMTLIELIVAVGIFSVVAGFAAVRISGFMSRAKASSAEAAVETITLGISMMKADTGQYPRELSDLSSSRMPSYINLPARYWNGPYVPGTSLTDPWGEPYLYELLYEESEAEGEVFGPYVFSTGSPGPGGHHYEGTFTFEAASGPGELIMLNAPNPVTSGTLTLNGNLVASGSDFSPAKPNVAKNLELQDNNTIEIELKGAHSREVVITITGKAQGTAGEARGFRLGSAKEGQGARDQGLRNA